MPIVYLDPIFIIHLSIDGHLDGFRSLAIMERAAITKDVQMSL